MGAAARDTLERDGNLLEGVFDPRSSRGPARGGRPAPERGRVSLGGRPTLERDRTSLEGETNPRARRICTEAVSYPSCGAEFCPRVAGPIV
jgi:hypothetical protein